MKRSRGKDIKIVRKAARAKLADSIKEAGKTQRRIRKGAEKLDQQVESAVKAVEAVEAQETAAVVRQFESLNKRPCVLGEKCVFAKDGKPRSFVPALTVSGISTERHCSVECASWAMGIRVKGYNIEIAAQAERPARAQHLAAFREPSVAKEFPIGAEVVYQGGARTDKFKEGDVLVVKKSYAEGRRYAVKGGKVTTVVASKYLTLKEAA